MKYFWNSFLSTTVAEWYLKYKEHRPNAVLCILSVGVGEVAPHYIGIQNKNLFRKKKKEMSSWCIVFFCSITVCLVNSKEIPFGKLVSTFLIFFVRLWSFAPQNWHYKPQLLFLLISRKNFFNVRIAFEDCFRILQSVTEYDSIFCIDTL